MKPPLRDGKRRVATDGCENRPRGTGLIPASRKTTRHMKAIFLGTGTSAGIPIIGCDCAVCTSTDRRNKRLRTSLYVEAGGTHVVVDTTPDFREQALRYRMPRVDAVLFTHSHADHIFGFDEIRRYNTMQDAVIPAYADAAALEDLKRIFDYVGTERVPGFYRPRINFECLDGPLSIGAMSVEPVDVMHGPATILGFRFEHAGRTLGYVPDCSSMSPESVSRFGGVDVMILDALRHRPHKTHLTVTDSIALLARIDAAQSYIVHMCHDLDHAETEATLPDGVKMAYDGLVVEV